MNIRDQVQSFSRVAGRFRDGRLVELFSEEGRFRRAGSGDTACCPRDGQAGRAARPILSL